MTFEQCHASLLEIRRKQRTRHPLVRIDYAGMTYQGRVARTDSDPENRRDPSCPYGILVLENPGLSRGPETILQIANIGSNAIHELEDGMAN